MSMYDANNKCTECNEGVQKYREYLPGLTKTYFSCGHQSIGAVINETIGIRESIDTKLHQDISKDYEELASFSMTMSRFKTAKLADDEEGKIIFNGFKEKLFEFICVKSKACEKMKALDNNDLTTVFQWVSDILTSFLVGIPLPTVTIARIIVKRGIGNFCNCV